MPPLNKKEIVELQKQLKEGWTVSDDKMISKEFLFVNYLHTMDFVNKVAKLAEGEGHHPVMHVYYAKILIELWTHSISGLSENDFILAAKIDKL